MMRVVVQLLALAALLAFLPPASASSNRRNAGIVWAQDEGIYGADADGARRRGITDYDGGFVPDNFASPAWSPSGRTLAYNNCDSGACLIHLVDPAARARRTVRRFGLGLQNDPTWSPDGSELAFEASTTDRGGGISAVSLTSMRLRTITEPESAADESPAWSPDGRTIAFTRIYSFPFKPVLFLVGQDGRGLRSLTVGFDPSWSPDGRWIVFAWGNGIHRISSDGRERARLARIAGARGYDLKPRWSPDGRKILYITTPSGRRPTIWTMNADGSNRRRVIVLRGPRQRGGTNLNGAGWKPG
jgi:Tol biopolymer transport system component